MLSLVLAPVPAEGHLFQELPSIVLDVDQTVSIIIQFGVYTC